MKLKIDNYPFAVSAETKESKAGKEYISIGVSHSFKDKNGDRQKTYFNFIDERDLLVLANALNRAYAGIISAKNEEHFKDTPKEEQPKDEVSESIDDEVSESIDDEIPF